MSKPLIVAAGVNGALAVGFAAFGAHALPLSLPEPLRSAYETGADFHLMHAAALVAVAALAGSGRSAGARIAFAIVLAGSTLFSFSLYAYALTGTAGFAMATPVGGAALIAGWLALAVAGLRRE